MFQKIWPFSSSTTTHAHSSQAQHGSNNSGGGGGSEKTSFEDHGESTRVKPIHSSFNKGIPLNMKIVIRGDVRTGKSSLLQRLQGFPSRDPRDYHSTPQIEVANIPWQYPQTKDIIKVEVWDVVDKGIQVGALPTPKRNSVLKFDNSASKSKAAAQPQTSTLPHASFALDASTIDVYRNTDGVLLMFDVAKAWTFDYVGKILDEVPLSIPVLILGNFTDHSTSGFTANDSALRVLMERHNEVRKTHPCAPANLVRFLETNMFTGLGLREIHASFAIPFLNVLRETHRKQFEQKSEEIVQVIRALDDYEPEIPHCRHSSIQTSISHDRRKLGLSIQTGELSPTSSSRRKPLPIVVHNEIPDPEPTSSTPASPARRTKNEHTNVDIWSPTPVSATTPVVLLDFNTGHLEDEFFQTVELEPAATTTLEESGETANDLQLHMEAYQQEVENPMVMRDEDIGNISSDDEGAFVSDSVRALEASLVNGKDSSGEYRVSLDLEVEKNTMEEESPIHKMHAVGQQARDYDFGENSMGSVQHLSPPSQTHSTLLQPPVSFYDQEQGQGFGAQTPPLPPLPPTRPLPAVSTNSIQGFAGSGMHSPTSMKSPVSVYEEALSGGDDDLNPWTPGRNHLEAVLSQGQKQRVTAKEYDDDYDGADNDVEITGAALAAGLASAPPSASTNSESATIPSSRPSTEKRTKKKGKKKGKK